MAIKTKYDQIGIDYDQTRSADKYLTERILYHLNPITKGRYLDIGCGTGNYTDKLRKKGFELIGIDPSGEMLLKAIQKNKDIDWRLGHAEHTDLKDEFVDGAIAVLTIHHWENLCKGFAEMFRVLKSNSRIVIFTSTPVQMQGYWLNYYFPEILKASVSQMPSLEVIEESMKKAGFILTGTETYFIKPDLEDLFLFSGKHNPELYLRPEVRRGISSFSPLSNQDEVESGLFQMKQDIESGKINEIMKLYENGSGDYLFIIGKKEGSKQ